MQFVLAKLAPLKVLICNAGWLLSVELLSKLSRILTIIALAASLTPIDYGTAMLALASHEVIRLILRSGTGAQIVQCAEKDLAEIAGNAYVVQWIFCLGLALLQVGLAFVIGAFYDNSVVTDLLIGMAAVYCLYPIVSVKVFLLQRANKMRAFSLRNGLCILSENLCTAAFAFAGSGLMAVVAGKWAFAICWLIGFYRLPVPSIPIRVQWQRIKTLFHSSSQLVFIEISRAARLHMDVFIAAKLLTPELFGLYSFAKNAGVGLTHSISNAFVAALYPYLCGQNRQVQAGQQQAWIYALATGVGGFFLIQAVLVPVYVPILFDEKWQLGHTTTALLCITGLPAIWIDILCTYKRSLADYKAELFIRTYCLVCSFTVILLVSPQTPEAFAQTLLASSALWLICLLPIGKVRRSLCVLQPFSLIRKLP